MLRRRDQSPPTTDSELKAFEAWPELQLLDAMTRHEVSDYVAGLLAERDAARFEADDLRRQLYAMRPT